MTVFTVSSLALLLSVDMLSFTVFVRRDVRDFTVPRL